MEGRRIEKIPIEQHPLEPFLPQCAKLLMLGSFPPQRKRWKMEFYYPNMQNDMWRIFGLIFFADRNRFVNLDTNEFKKEEIVTFLQEKGIAIYDTATSVRRLQDNASDKYLEVVESTDVSLLLKHLPCCRAIVTTGQKATETLCAQFDVKEPSIGSFVPALVNGREIRLYRMPSSSRAYPLALEKKAAFYAHMYRELDLL